MEALTTYVRTTEERDVLVDEFGELLTTFFKTDESEFQTMLNTSVSLRTAELVHVVLQERNIPIEQREDVKKVIQELKKTLESLKEIQINVAIKPQHEFLSDMSGWINENIQQNSVIRLTIRPEILGGVTLLFEGKYINVSLEKKIDDLFIQHHDEIFPLLS